MAVGRPTLYKPEFCQMVIEHMMEGLSFESFAGIIDVSRAVLYDWCHFHPEFLDAKNRGAQASLLYWERLGRDSMHADKFQGSTYIFTMKARFKWNDQAAQKDEKTEREKEEIDKIRKMSDSELLEYFKKNMPSQES